MAERAFQRQFAINRTAVGVLCRWYDLWELYRAHRYPELRRSALMAKLTGLIYHDRIATGTCAWRPI